MKKRNLPAELIEAKRRLEEAKETECTCSGFYLQYEGSCGCERRHIVAKAENALKDIINAIMREEFKRQAKGEDADAT